MRILLTSVTTIGCEQAIQAVGAPHLIVRTSLVYRLRGIFFTVDAEVSDRT